MNSKYISVIVIVIIVCASIVGYLAYSGTLSANPEPTPTATPDVTPTATVSPTTTPTSTTSATTELRVFMASSLINAVTNMTATFEQENNCHLIINSAGSNTLYQQITSGSPCDVYMAAAFKWTQQLDDADLLLGGYENFTTNKLEVLLPGDNPQNITSLLDLVEPGVKIVVADDSVPVGSYTNKTVTKIDATWGNSSSPLYKGAEWDNFKQKFYDNVVSYEASVEDVVGKVALNLGTVDAGVAFVSDATYGAMAGSDFVYVEVPTEVNTIGTYGIAVTSSTTNTELAQKYMDFWLSTEGQDLLHTFGFGT
jgi:molybdate transport system substrate-binding protein